MATATMVTTICHQQKKLGQATLLQKTLKASTKLSQLLSMKTNVWLNMASQLLNMKELKLTT